MRALLSSILARAAAVALAGLAACGGGTSVPGDLTGKPCAADNQCSPPAFVCYATGACAAGCAATGCPSGESCNAATGRCSAGAHDGGTQPDGGSSDGGPACKSDEQCLPPFKICGGAGACTDGCLTTGCADGLKCNGDTGRCLLADGGTPPDAGPSDGGTSTDAGSDGGVFSCQGDSDCLGPFFVCGADHRCVQSCLLAGCGAGLQCVGGHCVSADAGTPDAGPPDAGPPDAGSDGGTADGGAGDGGTADGGPADGGSDGGTATFTGCGYCGLCDVNAECASGSICVKGGCAPSCSSWWDCAVQGAYLATCEDVGDVDKRCVPAFGQACTGTTSCPAAAQMNPTCSAPVVPGADFTNTAPFGVDSSDSMTAPLPEASMARVGSSILAMTSEARATDGGTYLRGSPDDGASWFDGTPPAALSDNRTEPALGISRWTTAEGALRERLHAAWIGYAHTSPDMQLETAWADTGSTTWSASVVAVPGSGSGQLLEEVSVATGPAGVVALAFSIPTPGGSHAYVAVSLDHGEHWTAPLRIDSGTYARLPNVVLDPRSTDGRVLWAAWLEGTSVTPSAANAVKIATSSDYGQHWSAPVTASLAGEHVAFGAPSLALDAARNRLYVGWAGTPSPASAQLGVFTDARVATADVSVSPASVLRTRRVNDDGPACFKHLGTQVGVDASGRVVAMYLDSRDVVKEASGRRAGRGNAWVAVSSDSGNSFAASRRVSAERFPFDPLARGRTMLGAPVLQVDPDGTARMMWSDPRQYTSVPWFAKGSP